MIRDPSDGTVRVERPAEQDAAPATDPIFSEIKASILAGKVKPEKLSEEWVYQRAWNDALDFSLTQVGRVEKVSIESALALETGAENGHCPVLTDPSDAVAVNNSIEHGAN